MSRKFKGWMKDAINILALITISTYIASFLLFRTSSGVTEELMVVQYATIDTIVLENNDILIIDEDLREQVEVGYLCKFVYTRDGVFKLREVTDVYCDDRLVDKKSQ